MIRVEEDQAEFFDELWHNTYGTNSIQGELESRPWYCYMCNNNWVEMEKPRYGICPYCRVPIRREGEAPPARPREEAADTPLQRRLNNAMYGPVPVPEADYMPVPEGPPEVFGMWMGPNDSKAAEQAVWELVWRRAPLACRGDSECPSDDILV